MPKRIKEKRVRLATVETERHFVEVGREMLRADTMPRSHDSTLEQRECRFDRVRRNHEAVFVSDVLFRTMVDFLPLRTLRDRQALIVENRFVRHDHIYIFADVLFEDFADCLGVGIADMDELQLPVALNDADDRLFVVAVVPCSDAFFLSTDVGFIDFDGAVEHLLDLGHREADAVAKVPRGFVGALVVSPESPLHLQRGHAFLCFAEQQGGEKPLLQGKMAVVENRSGRNAELIIAALAVKQLLRGRKLDRFHLAPWALDAIGPAEPDKHLAALFVSIE